MPRRYSRRRRRRYPRRRRRGNFRQRVLAITNSSRRKYKDFTISLTADSSTGETLEATQVAQGASGTAQTGQRLTEHITVMGLNGRYIIENADTFNHVRVIIWRWKKASSPTVPSVLAAANYLANYNADSTAGQYKILYDRTHLVDSDDPSTNIKTFKLRINKPCLYSTSSGTSGYNGRIYIGAISDSLAAAHPVLTGFMRLIYTDA